MVRRAAIRRTHEYLRQARQLAVYLVHFVPHQASRFLAGLRVLAYDPAIVRLLLISGTEPPDHNGRKGLPHQLAHFAAALGFFLSGRAVAVTVVTVQVGYCRAEH